MSTTAFTTPYSINLFEPGWHRAGAAAWAWVRRAAWACGLLWALWQPALVHGQDEVTLNQIGLQRTSDGLFLNVRLALELGPAVQDALAKAVPMHFVYQADTVRKRWYWTDKVVASASRTIRLAYQPLTRRWRVSATPGAPGEPGLTHSLHQNHETLAEAMAAVGRLGRWPIADAQTLEDGERHSVQFRFRLDLSLLPRPWQIGMANQPEWNLALERTLTVPDRPADDSP